MAFAPPTRRGNFLYSSVLYADPGNNNRHPRASVAELAALLRPEAPSLYFQGHKPAASSPARDPPWHFYSAQLIHYGLPVTTDKNVAKVRLLTAMNQFKLEIPAWIIKLETELKNEWEAENRKLKRAGAIGSSTPEKTSKSKGKAKPSTGASNNVNVDVLIASVRSANFKVNLSLPLGLSMAEQPTSTPKKSTPAKRKRKDSDASTSALPIERLSTPTKRVKKGPIARKSTPRVKAENAASYGSPSPIRPKQECSPPEPQPGRYSDLNSGHDQAILLSGNYSIDATTKMFQDYDLDLTLARDPSGNAWWATFRWGNWDGIMQMRPGPKGVNQPCSLGWRLRDLKTGQLKFGKSCTGSMIFFPDQTLSGSLHGVPGVGVIDFEGARLKGPSVQDDLQHEWDAYVAEAYGR